VNLKIKPKSLDEKQSIFSRVVKGLKDKWGVSKKNKRKSRVLLKKVFIVRIVGTQKISGVIARQPAQH
jgi:uncharacterized protein YlxP (DUF503 family)